MNAFIKVTLNALMIVVSPLAVVAFSSATEAACHRASGKPGRLEPGGSRVVPPNLIHEFKG